MRSHRSGSSRRRALWLLVFLTLSFALIPTPATFGQKKGNCDQLLDELNKAQSGWEDAVKSWRKASDRLEDAQRRIADTNSQLKRLFGDLTKAEVELDSANADVLACKTNAVPAPLFDCAKAPQRAQSAKQKADSLRANYEAQQEELKRLESEAERLEDENAAAHEAERQAYKALETARENYAKCGQFWTGTITFRFVLEDGPKTVTNSKKGEDGGLDTSTTTQEYFTESRIEVNIQPFIAPDRSVNHSKAKVLHAYKRRDHYKREDDFATYCRLPNRPRFTTRFHDEQVLNEDEEGEHSTVEDVWVNRNLGTGEAEISIQYGSIMTKGVKHASWLNPGCSGGDPKISDTPLENSPVSEAYTVGNSLKIDVKFDPKNPDVLVGRRSDGDPHSTGQTTIIWNLKLVKPKQK